MKKRITESQLYNYVYKRVLKEVDDFKSKLIVMSNVAIDLKYYIGHESDYKDCECKIKKGRVTGSFDYVVKIPFKGNFSGDGDEEDVNEWFSKIGELVGCDDAKLSFDGPVLTNNEMSGYVEEKNGAYIVNFTLPMEVLKRFVDDGNTTIITPGTEMDDDDDWEDDGFDERTDFRY